MKLGKSYDNLIFKLLFNNLDKNERIHNDILNANINNTLLSVSLIMREMVMYGRNSYEIGK